ncbi:MAG: TonB-dependent receptor [Bacteroidetes bacterium]|nr:TonB-dependent receptor [Bacteroidota bacterium]
MMCLFLYARLDAQGVLRGRVVDPAGRNIAGAYVSLDGGKAFTFSNIYGRFLFRLDDPGTHTIGLSLVGYRGGQHEIHVSSSDTADFLFRLVPVLYQMQGVDVLAAPRTATELSAGFTVASLPPREVQFRAGAAEDVLRTLQSYPGVTSPNDFTTQLVVRGGRPEENLVILDGIEVLSPYRLYGIVSMFNPQTVERIGLLAGGFPARYSDRLSAVVDVANRDGSLSDRPFQARANLSITNVNLVAEGSFLLETHETDSARSDMYYAEDAPPWNGSWLLSTRRTYYDWIATPIVKAAGLAKGDVVLPTFQDFQFRLSLQPEYRHKIVFTGITNRDRASLVEGPAAGSIEEISLDDLTFNDVAGVQWLWTHSPELVGRYGVSFTQNGGTNSFSGMQNSATSFGLDLSTEEVERLQDSLRASGISVPDLLRSAGAYNFLFRKFSASASLVWQASPVHTLEAGVVAHRLLTDIAIGVQFDPRIFAIRQSNFRYSMLPDNFAASVSSLSFGAYVHDTYRISESITLEPGLRFDYFGIIARSTLAPRLAASYSWSPGNSIRLAWGMYYQSPGYEKSFIPGYETYINNTTFDLSGDRPAGLRPETASHITLSWETLLSQDWQLRIEAYQKSFRDLIFPAIVTGTLYRSERTGMADITRPEAWTQPVPVPGDSLTTIPANSATGASLGGEIVLQKIFRNDGFPLYGWLGYAYGKATRERQGWSYPFDFDRRHSVNVVLGYRCASWLDLNIAAAYGSGFPSTPPIGYAPRIYKAQDSLTGALTPKLDSDWRGVVFATDRGGLRNLNSGRLPDYFRLDFRATTYPEWFGWQWSFYVDVMNVTNHTNVALEEYYFDRSIMEYRTIQTHMFPILPSLGFTIQF